MSNVENYIPEKGDYFRWNDEVYFCVESGERSGVVNPVGENFYIRNFQWDFEGEKAVFFRKATQQEYRQIFGEPKKYVVAFLFNGSGGVWMVKKQKPDWQKGCLNGIGGKVEDDETNEEAIVRELKEEAGIDVEFGKDIVYCGGMGGMNNDGGEFEVYVYAGFTSQNLKTMEEEEIVLVHEFEVKQHPHIQNVPALIQLCRYKLTAEQSGSRFNEFWMKY